MFSLRRTSTCVLCISRPLIRTRFHPPNHQRWRVIRMASTLPRLPIFEALASHDPNSTVVVHSNSGRIFTYGQLLADVAEAKSNLRQEAGGQAIDGQRIAYIVENSYDSVVTLLSILGNHAVALPLCPAFPAHELRYILNHSEASMLLSSEMFESKAQEVFASTAEVNPIYVKLQKRLSNTNYGKVTLSETEDGEGGMMLYTSGTTSRPKGVLLPQSVMTAQSKSLVTAWNYSPSDYLLHVLPLHHIHGTINAILAPLFAGSAVEFLFPFNPTAVWNRFAAPFLPQAAQKEPITFFTVVPTVYNRLISTFPSLPPEIQAAAKTAISPRHLRLNISGSAAFPTPTKNAWSALSSGNVLLERYGMTEVGMALSCGLSFSSRVDGSVGWPLPSVQVRLVDTETNEVILPGEELDSTGRERDGEIQLRGPTIFKEYWRNAKATAAEHVEGEDGQGRWFKTGDVAVRRTVPITTPGTTNGATNGATNGTSNGITNGATNGTTNGRTNGTTNGDRPSSMPEWAHGPMYFIRGRKSADIIKSGGEKVSALEVERELLSLPQIEEAAVVAVPSGKWGQKVGAVVILKPGAEGTGKSGKKWSPMDMRRALKDRLANYKIPQVMKVVDEIPRNAMGKINKKQLVLQVFSEEMSDNEL